MMLAGAEGGSCVDGLPGLPLVDLAARGPGPAVACIAFDDGRMRLWAWPVPVAA